jgi:hypothetical protein
MVRALALAALAGCSSILGIEELDGPNNAPDGGARDAAVDVMIGDRISLTGTARTLDGQAEGQTLADAQLDFVSKGGVAQSTQTTASGSYNFLIPTNGQPIDGFIVVHQTAMVTYPHTYNVPPVLTADRSFAITTFSESFIQMMSLIAGEPHDPSATFVVFQVADTNGSGVAGIILSCEAGNRIIYGDASGFPTQSAVATSASGLAYIFNSQPFLGTCTASDLQGIVAQRTIDGGMKDPQPPGVIAIVMEVGSD